MTIHPSWLRRDVLPKQEPKPPAKPPIAAKPKRLTEYYTLVDWCGLKHGASHILGTPIQGPPSEQFTAMAGGLWFKKAKVIMHTEERKRCKRCAFILDLKVKSMKGKQ
mgnify:CR=1 FL=1